MRIRQAVGVLGIFAVAWTLAAPARAAVVILANDTAAQVAFTIIHPDGKQTRHALAAGDLMPIPATADISLAFEAAGRPCRYLLHPNSLHHFVTHEKTLDLRTLPPVPEPAGAAPAPAPPAAAPDALCTIPVMILADDDEPAVHSVWEKRFRKRLAAASEIFEHYCRVRFEVVAVSTWVSDNNIREFEKSLEEFERKVNPLPARVAIGFTSQYQKIQGRRHLGGTHGPLRPHILIREWSQEISEPERLEVLVHEMGHFLGAAHTPDDRSVMRPVLGDRRSRARSFRIGFDPSNALVMYLIGEELRSRALVSLRQLRPETKTALRPVYGALAKLTPDDPSTAQYIAMLGPSSQQ
jgi:hypothetical protein